MTRFVTQASAPTTAPPPAPPAVGSPPMPPPPPAAPQWAPPPKPRRRSRFLVLLALLPVGVVVAAVLLLANAAKQPNEDAREALRAARADVARSLDHGETATKHTMALLKGKSFTRNRRIALRELDRTIVLGRRAIAHTEGVPGKADGSYRQLGAELSGYIQNANSEARGLRTKLRRLSAADMRAGPFTLRTRSGFIVAPKASAATLSWTRHVGAQATLSDFERSMRRANSWIR